MSLMKCVHFSEFENGTHLYNKSDLFPYHQDTCDACFLFIKPDKLQTTQHFFLQSQTFDLMLFRSNAIIG